MRTVFDGTAIEENIFLNDLGESDMNKVRLTIVGGRPSTACSVKREERAQNLQRIPTKHNVAHRWQVRPPVWNMPANSWVVVGEWGLEHGGGSSCGLGSVLSQARRSSGVFLCAKNCWMK